MNVSLARLYQDFGAVPVETLEAEDLASAARRLWSVAPSCPMLAYSIHQYRRFHSVHRPWTFIGGTGMARDGVALATLGRGRINVSLGVSVWPSQDGSPDLIREIFAFAARHRVNELWIERFGPVPIASPDGAAVRKHDSAQAYVLDLASFERRRNLSKNHARNIGKAEKYGIRVIRGETREAVRAHAAMWRDSMQRREDRGERIGEEMGLRRIARYLDAGTGRLFQAIVAGRVVSSALMVRVGDDVFYDSGGSEKQGMELGAAQLVMCTAIERYRDAGGAYFNFGVATPDRPGLTRFKQGFGAEAHDFAVTTFDMKGPLELWFRALRELTRR